MERFPELDDTLQDLSEVLDRRLVVVDESMHVVAYSIHESPEDRTRLFHLLTHSDSWPAPATATTPYCVNTPPDLSPTAFVRLLDPQKHIIGHLLVPVGDTTEDATLPETLTAAAEQVAELLLARRSEETGRMARSHELTRDLVTDDPSTRTAAAEALLAERRLSSSPHYCAVTLGVDPRSATRLDHEKTSQAVARTLRFVRETSTATVVGGVLDDHTGVLVFPRPVVAERLARILRSPQVNPVRAGIGPLTALTDMHLSFARARLAWRASWLAPTDHDVVTSWESVGLDGTLARLPVEDFTADDLPPAVRDLVGAVDSPALISTLETYLDAGGDAQRTARLLHIHRSTLYYRLDKLRAIIDGDLSDGVVRRELHTGLRLARLAGLLPGQ